MNMKSKHQMVEQLQSEERPRVQSCLGSVVIQSFNTNQFYVALDKKTVMTEVFTLLYSRIQGSKGRKTHQRQRLPKLLSRQVSNNQLFGNLFAFFLRILCPFKFC